jgi:hypothetical protein
MRFREHRGTLAESLETAVEIESRAELIAHLRTVYQFEIRERDLVCRPYASDPRVEGQTYIVTLAGFGVLGFLNGPL